MAEVFLICGRICSGKSRYGAALATANSALILSCDEIESMIFHHQLYERHDEVAADIERYLHMKAADAVRAGCNVVLDWGFWSRSERKAVSQLYQSLGIKYTWHYVEISDDDYALNIKDRNAAVLAGKSDDYFIDDGLYNKAQMLFDAPLRDEIDVWYVNKRVVED